MAQSFDQFGNPIDDPTQDLLDAGLGSPAQSQSGGGSLNTGTVAKTGGGGALPNQNGVFTNPNPTPAGPYYQPGTSIYDPVNAAAAAAPPNAQTGLNAGELYGQKAPQTAPSYVNLQDPNALSVWQAFSAKGIQPRDQGDFQYWVDKMNSDPSYNWKARMAQSQGGVGDYSEGGGGGGSSASAQAGSSPDFSGLEALLQQQMSQSQARDAASADYNKKIHDSILSQIDANSQPIDPSTDHTIQAATQAHQASGERNLELEREALAEAAHAGGATSGSVAAGTQQAFERMGQGEASYSANLVLDRLKQQQAALQSAIGQGAGVMTAEESQQAQERLANINAQIQTEGLKANTGLAQQSISNQNGQFYDTYAAGLAGQNNNLNSLLESYLLHQGAA